MNYIIGTLTILILVTLLPFLYFLYMVEYCRQQRWSPRQTIVPSYREAYTMATKKLDINKINMAWTLIRQAR